MRVVHEVGLVPGSPLASAAHTEIPCAPHNFSHSPKLPIHAKLDGMSLVVRPSPIHSVGVYTSKPIRKGKRLVEYKGPRITPEEADRLYDGASRTYLYGLEDGKTVIDGEGLGAYLNHSCDPNCEIDEIKGRVWLFALRDIAAGEELVWDYNLYDDDEPAPCHCGSRRCRGTMYGWYSRARRASTRWRSRIRGRPCPSPR